MWFTNIEWLNSSYLLILWVILPCIWLIPTYNPVIDQSMTQPRLGRSSSGVGACEGGEDARRVGRRCGGGPRWRGPFFGATGGCKVL